MSAGALPATGRWALAAVFALACASATAAQTPANPTAEDAKLADRRLHLQEITPLFPHIGLAVLQELKQLEPRPEAGPGEWAEALRRAITCDSPRCWPGPRSPSEEIIGRDRVLNEEEQEVRDGGVQRRLIGLAITGRITKEEYDGFVKRLQGN